MTFSLTNPVTDSNPLPVTGTFSANSSGTATAANPTYVEGSTGQPLSLDLSGRLRVLSTITGSLAVTGTFWQATQPVSAASLPLPTGAALDATIVSSNTKLDTLHTDLATTLHADLIAATPAGTNLIGKVGIDQTTPGTTNGTVPAGNVASGATDSGNPIKIAGVYNSTPPTLTTGQRGNMQLDVNGNLQARLMITGGAVGDAVPTANTGTMRSQDNTTNLMLTNVQNAFNGISYDRIRTITGAIADGTGLGVTAVEQAGALFNNITTATTTTVKSGKGILHKIVMNTYVASATITIYDNTAASGTKIGTLTLPSTITSDTPLALPYDLQFTTGLTLVTSGATDLTVIYR